MLVVELQTRIDSMKPIKPGEVRAALKRAICPEARQYGVRGRPCICPLCGHDRCAVGDDRSITGLYTLDCADCGHVEFFANAPYEEVRHLFSCGRPSRLHPLGARISVGIGPAEAEGDFDWLVTRLN